MLSRRYQHVQPAAVVYLAFVPVPVPRLDNVPELQLSSTMNPEEPFCGVPLTASLKFSLRTSMFELNAAGDVAGLPSYQKPGNLQPFALPGLAALVVAIQGANSVESTGTVNVEPLTVAV